MRGDNFVWSLSSRSPWRRTKTAFSLQRTLLNTSAMSASPMESMGSVATGASTQFGSRGVVPALDAGGSAVAELEISGVWTTEELDSAIGATAELSGCCWMTEDVGTVVLDVGTACSLEELATIPPWLGRGAAELSSPHAVKRAADKNAPEKAKEIREILCIA